MNDNRPSASVCLTLAAALGASALAALPAQAAPKMRATITRTTYGIPHIKAKDFAGLGFGAAYAQAQDNICLLADAYLSASGERSKFLGADAPAVIGVWAAKNSDNDIFYRTIADRDALEAEFAKRGPEYRALVTGWVAGYNRFLKDHERRLPAACAGQPWVRPITRDNVLRWINSFGLFASSAGLSVQLARTAPPSGVPGAGDAAPPAPAKLGAIPTTFALGSNGWAFGAEATTNGKGLVVGNPHFPWTGPHRFYQMQLTIPGKFDVAGAGIMGQPYVGIGFNKDIAWTHTTDTAVHMTLVKLTLDPADPTAYLIDGKREPMIRREIVVENKGGAPVTRTLYASRHGPIVSLPGTPYGWTRDTAYAVIEANRNNIRTGDNYVAFGRARTVRDIRASLIEHLGVPFLNTMAADRHGDALFADIAPAPNISDEKFGSCGTIGPKLVGLYNHFYVLDGSRADCDWDRTSKAPMPGLLSGEKMASTIRRDYVQNSNDSYRWSNPAEPPVERGVMLGMDPRKAPDLRTRAGLQAIRDVLKTGKFDVDLGAATMLGNKNFAAQLALPKMLELCKRPAAPADACAALAKWDGKAEVTSRAAMLFAAFWLKAGVRPDIWKTPFDPADPVGTPADLNIDGAAGDALLADLAAGAALLKGLGVALDAPLGEIQYAVRGTERIPMSGISNGGVLNYMAAVPAPGGFPIIFGSSYIQSVTFDEKGPVAKAVLTYSQSADPASPHFADQTRAFSRKELRRYPFSAAEIAADAIGKPLVVSE
jgi:acyl-homoserine-lactone acylase